MVYDSLILGGENNAGKICQSFIWNEFLLYPLTGGITKCRLQNRKNAYSWAVGVFYCIKACAEIIDFLLHYMWIKDKEQLIRNGDNNT